MLYYKKCKNVDTKCWHKMLTPDSSGNIYSLTFTGKFYQTLVTTNTRLSIYHLYLPSGVLEMGKICNFIKNLKTKFPKWQLFLGLNSAKYIEKMVILDNFFNLLDKMPNFA